MTRFPFGNNDGNCAFQCAKDHYLRNFNCFLNGTSFNRCHQMKTVRLLFEKHRLNLSSYAPIISSRYFLSLEQYARDFSNSSDKIKTLINFVTTISDGHEAFIIEHCKQQCQKAPPFCTSWDITIEKTYVGETVVNVVNATEIAVHDMYVHLHYKIKHSMLVYQETPMISLDNFVGQLGGLIGLYIGWSFLSIIVILLEKFVAIKKPVEPGNSTRDIRNIIYAGSEITDWKTNGKFFSVRNANDLPLSDSNTRRKRQLSRTIST